MAKPISPFGIGAPGFYGLNLSDSPVDLSANFALEANNCVIDRYGRVAARKGWTQANSTSADLSTANVECIGELVQNDGTTTTLCAGNGKLLKLSAGALVNLTYGGGGVAPTISDNNWYFCQLNGIAMFWQRGYDPLIYDPAVSTTTYRRLSEKSGSVGTVYQCNVAISAYGRVWAADTSTDKQTVVFSDLLTPHIWTGGTSGSLDLRQVWPSGGDEIVGFAAHNEFLFIFGKWQTLIYSNATDPAAMKLSDAIVGVGCIARDSIQNIGEDIFFLSDSGVQSLRRVIQEKSAPMVSVSKNVEEVLKLQITNETSIPAIKAGYSASNHFYLLTLPTNSTTYCFDTRTKLPDDSCRVTQWPGTTSKSFYETNARKFYMGKAGYIGEYSGYVDNTASYVMSYFSSWIDFGNPTQISILKKIFADVIGARDQAISFRWGFDFNPNQYLESASISNSVLQSSEYGIAEYNSNSYNTQVGIDRVWVNTRGTGRVVQFGVSIPIVGYGISIQRMDVFTKEGRI